MNDLDRAKELREKINYWRNFLNNKTIGKESFDLCIKEYLKEAKQLKEKVEKGCGREDINLIEVSLCPGMSKYTTVKIDNKEVNAHFEIGYSKEICCNSQKCKDCQETLKILNEILGDKE